jgi:large subunit ribosomal protein L10
MDKSTKQAFVESYSAKLARARMAVVTDYRGVSVNDLTGFRKALAATEGNEFRIVKNRLFKLVLDGTDMESLSEFFVGTNAILLGYEDVVGGAKALLDFAKEHKEKVIIKGGVLDGKTITPQQVKALADLPSKEILQAMLLGVLSGPARNLVSVLANANRQILNVLVAYKDKLEEEAGGAAE